MASSSDDLLEDLKLNLNKIIERGISAMSTELKAEIDRMKEKITSLQDENANLRQEKSTKSGYSLSGNTSNHLASTIEKLKVLQLSQMETSLEKKVLEEKVLELENRLAVADDKIAKGEILRRKMHNTIMELKGNIRVFCRVRPPLSVDGIDREGISFPSSANLAGRSVVVSHHGKDHTFEFDKVFTPDSSQEDVFVEISHLVQSALDGYKVCIFAYGQTGSGKTYTMMGKPEPADQKGLIPRSLEQIFEIRQTHQAEGWEHEMQVSMLEIYNESIQDLLATTENKCIIRLDGEGNSYAANLTKVDVYNTDQVLSLLDHATYHRSVGRTQMNEQSSRSHFLFTLRIKAFNRSTHETVEGILNLIDLAGSERLPMDSTSKSKTEIGAINRSLSALSDVIFALTKPKREHVPYRNSKLTQLLQPCFGGDSKTLMFVNVSPESQSVSESLCSLRFASKVNACEIGCPRRQI